MKKLKKALKAIENHSMLIKGIRKKFLDKSSGLFSYQLGKTRYAGKELVLEALYYTRNGLKNYKNMI
ncbi:hypothetical protein [Bacteroidetes bacterium endosymbiont of Geopemphigus sp.]|uniref:hypothetical protein n=1 Tax=Bacteroidetes bacterium endosymbiont of Geopemphigus sp. TaxID=2047937 RepID=UPI000CD31589|nr:hypothetical protein [Bacteroidetes bacterium endosymbiont of Geopemphigus sp.]